VLKRFGFSLPLAFQCFQEASLLFYKQPKIWIRLTECCIASHVKKLHDSRKNKNSLVRKVAAHGDSRRIILPTTKGPKLKEDATEISNTDDSNLPPGSIQSATISLEFGAKSARNALFLLSRNSSTLSEEELQMSTYALVDLAYISLATYNPVVALSTAKELLAMKNCTEAQKFLGNVYAAEALCMLGRANEAADHLNPSTLGITESTANLPSSPYSPFSPDPSLNMRYSLLVNLAIVHIMKEDLVQAQQYLTLALSLSKSTAGLLLQVYLELRKGNIDSALRLLKVGSNFAPGKSGE